MHRLILVGLLGAFLASCSLFHVHKVEVEQGNIITESRANRLHPGLTKSEVKAILGEPILINIMNPRLESYVYTSQLGSNPRIEKKLSLVFREGVLVSIQREGI